MRLYVLAALSACTPATVELGEEFGSADDTGSPVFTDACPNVTSSESGLTWSSIPVGTASARTITVTNACAGETPLTIAARIDGDGVFTVTTSAYEILPGERATLTVTFAPTTGGDSSATL